MSYVAKIMMDDVPLPRLISRSPSTSSTHRPSQVSHPPGRNEHRPWPRHRQTDKTLLFLIICACLFSITSASSVYIEESMVEVQTHSDAQVIQAELDRLAQTGRILVDPNPPSDPNAWILATEHDDLQRRGLDHLYLPHQQHHEQERRAAHSSSSSSSTTMITTTKPTSTATATSSGVSVATDTSSFTLPAPFDQGFGNNVTESCSNFLLSFLTNQTFQSCLPFSLLLQVRSIYPMSLTDHRLTHSGLNLLLHSLQIHHQNHPNPRRNLRRRPDNLHSPHDLPRHQPHPSRKLRLRLHEPEPLGPERLPRPARLRTALHGLLPAQSQHKLLLFRGCCDQRLVADGQLPVLPAAEHQSAGREPADV